MPVLYPREPTLAESIRALMRSPPPPPLPAPRVRTCHGCFNTFHLRQHGSHVRNDCGRMISVDQLRAEIQEYANLCAEDSISFTELGVLIERIAVTRLSSINASLDEGEDITVRVNGKRKSLLDHERKTRERVEARTRRRAERGVHTVTDQVSRMEL